MKKLHLLSLCFMLFISGNIYSQLLGWNYYTPLTLIETSGSSLYNYQARVVVPTLTYISAGHMNASGSDIRFGNDQYGTQLYNYWIEAGLNTDSTVIWIKIDTLLAHQCKTIYMFYGYSGATPVSAIAGTFYGPFSATDSVTPAGTASVPNPGYNMYTMGFSFTPNTNILVTSLGAQYISGVTKYTTLFTTGHTKLAQVQASNSAVEYYSIGGPLWLTSGSSYMLASYANSASYAYANTTHLNQYLAYGGTSYSTFSTQGSIQTQNSYPYTSFTSELAGIPDMQFYAAATASSPPRTFWGTNNLTINPAPAVFECSGHSITIGDTAQGAIGSVSYTWTPATGLSNTHIAEPSVTALNTGVYTVSARDAGTGCVATAAVTVNVLNPGYGTITDSVCFGQVYSFGTGNYTTPGIYRDTMPGAAVSGCDSIVTLHLSIHHVAKPIIDQNGDVLLTGAYASYQWLVNNRRQAGATADSITGINNYTYQVIGTDGSGCSDTSDVYTFSTLGIHNVNSVSEINVYPNPGTGHFYIAANALYACTTYTVADELGRKVTTGRFTTSATELNMTDAPAGVYILSFTGGTKRLLVIK